MFQTSANNRFFVNVYIDTYVYLQPVNIWGATAVLPTLNSEWSSANQRICTFQQLFGTSLHQSVYPNHMSPVSCPTEKEARSVLEEELQKLRSDLGEEKARMHVVCGLILSSLT